MDVFEAMDTCRAMRYLKPDPVPDELIEKVIWAATRASNPGNSQGWEFLVVRDPALKTKLQSAVGDPMLAALGNTPEADLDPGTRNVVKGARNLARTLGEAPVIILVCGRNVYPPGDPNELFVWSALYPASQNLILAARALGLGTTFTTVHFMDEGAVRDILGIPDDVYIGTVIPMGWPDRDFGPVRRNEVTGVVRYDRW
jgi:nitroreductase